MTDEEYTRITAYERLQQDAKTLEDAALIIENHSVVPYPDNIKHDIVMKAMSICQASLPTLFRETAYTIKKKWRRYDRRRDKETRGTVCERSSLR